MGCCLEEEKHQMPIYIALFAIYVAFRLWISDGPYFTRCGCGRQQ